MRRETKLPDSPDSVKRPRFRIFRWLMLVVYTALALFFGMLLNLRPAGWVGTALLLALTSWLSRRLAGKGCLVVGLVWLAGLVAVLFVFALTVRL
ncbi:MAG: hypothetical protein GX153_05120 [Clostridiaceae bacterium]|nr:hypothetical protein [Clostridiaceae bacterium]